MRIEIQKEIDKATKTLAEKINALFETELTPKTEKKEDVTVRQLELMIRDLKHAVKQKAKTSERFRTYELSNKAASAAHQQADEAIEKAEKKVKGVCKGIAEGYLSIVHVTTEDRNDSGSNGAEETSEQGDHSISRTGSLTNGSTESLQADGENSSDPVSSI